MDADDGQSIEALTAEVQKYQAQYFKANEEVVQLKS